MRRLRLLPFAGALCLLVGCGSPTGPDIPNPDPEEDPDDPKNGIRNSAFVDPLQVEIQPTTILLA